MGRKHARATLVNSRSLLLLEAAQQNIILQQGGTAEVRLVTFSYSILYLKPA